MGVTAAVAAVVGTTYAVYSGEQAAGRAKDAAEKATTNAKKQAAQADEANNRANQKSPDTKAILDAVTQSGKGGAAGTMLTGPQGVDLSALQLGKNTLLGG